MMKKFWMVLALVLLASVGCGASGPIMSDEDMRELTQELCACQIEEHGTAATACQELEFRPEYNGTITNEQIECRVNVYASPELHDIVTARSVYVETSLECINDSAVCSAEVGFDCTIEGVVAALESFPGSESDYSDAQHVLNDALRDCLY